VLDPNCAHGKAAEQKLVMQISTEAKQLLIDPAQSIRQIRARTLSA
jgi:hypothetical protein